MRYDERYQGRSQASKDAPLPIGIRAGQRLKKRTLDLALSLMGLMAVGWLIIVCYMVATLDTGRSGMFSQARVGLGGRSFMLYKIRTMRPDEHLSTTVTSACDPRITRIGRFMRRTKLDELPQLWNVLLGDMSFVGPRPDVPGFADLLEGEASVILSVRPGITGPASLAFRDEESLLAAQSDPERYNREVIYPRKVQLNLDYIHTWSLRNDIKYIWHTLVGKIG